MLTAADTMDTWDEAKLASVVNSKKATNRTTTEVRPRHKSMLTSLFRSSASTLSKLSKIRSTGGCEFDGISLTCDTDLQQLGMR